MARPIKPVTGKDLEQLKKLYDEKCEAVSKYEAYILLLHDEMGYTLRQIAEVIGVSHPTALRWITRAKAAYEKNSKNL